MYNNSFRNSGLSTRGRNGWLAALALGCAVGAITFATAQPSTFGGAPPQPSVSSPVTSTTITPDPGNSAFLLGRAIGTQGYVCLPSGTGASWTVNGARPEATLFTDLFGKDFQIITHFLSPDTNPDPGAPVPFANATWQNSLDSSKVWAAVPHNNVVKAGTEAACPNTGSIPCLLLQRVGAQAGPAGGSFMTQVTFIQRLNTNGGSAPADGCAVPTDVGKQVLVPYTADYWFFRADSK